MKTQNYCNLEQEIKQKADKLVYKSWRGNLSKEALKSAQWGIDLKQIEQESLDCF